PRSYNTPIQNNNNQRPNLSPLSVSDNNISTRSNRSPRSPRPFYDAPLSSDSGYSSNSNNYAPQKQSNNNNYAPLQPSTPTSSTFLNKYAAAKDPYNTQTSRDPPYAQVYDNDSYQTQTPKQFDSYDNRQNNNINNNRYPSTTSSSSSNSNDNYSYDGRDYPRTTNELRVRDRSPGNYDRSNNGKPNGYDSPYDRQPQISRKNAPDNQIDKLLNDLISEMDNTNICAYCDSKINSSPMWALDKAWHPHHLLCTSCQKPIDPNEFLGFKKKIFLDANSHKFLEGSVELIFLPKLLGPEWYDDDSQ
ncbi:13009_t:CDS:2, partial [Entrophospora sp. SA101]